MRLECLRNSFKALKQKSGVNTSMETQTNGFLWTLLTRKKTKKYKNNLIKNKIERANTELIREDSTKPQSQIRMFSRRKKTFLSFTLSLLYLFVAPVMQVLPVYSAEPAEVISVWEVMETQLVGANSIITDQAVVNAYASNLGSIAAEGATAEVINIGIQNAASQCGVDLGQVFSNTAESAAAVGVNAAAASGAENIAASCAAVTAGGLASAVLPALGGIAVSAGTYYIVNGLQHICYMVNDIFRNEIETGMSLSKASLFEQLIPNMQRGLGGSTGTAILTSDASYKNLFYPCATYQDGALTFLCLINTSSSYITGNLLRNGGALQNKSLGPYSRSYDAAFGTGSYQISGGTPFANYQELDQYLANLRNGVIQAPLPQANGLSSVNGPLIYDPDNADPDILIPNIPELTPLPDYANGYGLAPIPEADYQSIVTYINGMEPPKTEDDQERQKEIIPTYIRPIIDPRLTPIGDPSPGPGTDPQPTGTPDPQPTGSPDPQPTGSPNPNPNPDPRPDTQPFPDPETVPQPTPVVNPTPDSDVVPAPVPYPDPETPTEQDKTDTDTKITPIDLRDKFPFCIPFDILKIMKLFQGGREAPCFTWEIPFGAAGSGSVTVDLSAWDSAAALLRTLELILFIMLLAVGTRNLIGGSS